MENKGEIIIYRTKEGETSLEVKLEEDTVWLNQYQMAELFRQTKQNISLHINNCFREKELDRNSVVKESLTTAKDGKKYKTQYYNLDVIISVGYRVKSIRGTQFRIWANKVLKNYLVKGYAVNEKILKEQSGKLKELQSTIRLIKNVSINKELTTSEASGLLNVISEYSEALDILDRYDKQTLTSGKGKIKSYYRITYDDVLKIVEEMKIMFGSSGLFGKERKGILDSSVNAIYQTFGKKDLYPSIEQKAANLLYFLVKNHPFIDGNKRIAAALFVYFMHRNRILKDRYGKKIIDNNTLVALTLLIAESKPSERDMLVKVIINLIIRD